VLGHGLVVVLDILELDDVRFDAVQSDWCVPHQRALSLSLTIALGDAQHRSKASGVQSWTAHLRSPGRRWRRVLQGEPSGQGVARPLNPIEQLIRVNFNRDRLACLVNVDRSGSARTRASRVPAGVMPAARCQRLAASSATRLTPYFLAIRERVSPRLTT